MIELGIVRLVNSSPAVSAIIANGGFFVELPKDPTLPAWTYKVITDEPDYTLAGFGGCSYRRIQIDCQCNTGADCINLASAIDEVLSGFRGALPDPDSTVMQGCFRDRIYDDFNDKSRSYRRMLEYKIWFSNPN